ncbi:PREDICTED: cytochrome P450 6a2-like [Dufourea novaeangliae]|uniref:cytochrome P450 6a2-like n=1 Tax=Dufourea novaeangliae TaxID=178035 RepID=UPI000767D41F|nr:PREDICTED: cytochrome P450 6a2-like [Dufourea novaeangliae]
MASYFEILCAAVVLFLVFYYYCVSTYDFWKKRGVSGPKPLPFFGNAKDLVFERISLAKFVQSTYETYKHLPMIGIYMCREPLLFLNDPDLIKDVLIRDFNKFADRGLNVHERTEPLSPNLFFLESERWRPLRKQFSPMFSSKKLKDMFPIMLRCSVHLEKYLDKLSKKVPVDIRDVAAKYTTNVIGNCAFGIDMNAMEEQESEFYRIAKQFIAPSRENSLRLIVRRFSPKLYDLLGYIVPDRIFAPFFTKLVMDTIQYRKEHDFFRPDFINTLIELRKHPEQLENIELTDTFLTAQLFIFFVAGFHTSATTMSNALYELALHHDLQNKLRAEITEYYDKSDGELQYETINEMKYLDKVIKETLRMYPAGPDIRRKATSSYTFDSMKVTIPKSMSVIIPLFAIHRDANMYPNPDQFDPERFSEEAIAARHPMSYLAFGEGPRNCIALRFGYLLTKLGLIKVLRNHKVDVCEKTMIPYEFEPKSFTLTPKGEIYLMISKI